MSDYTRCPECKGPMGGAEGTCCDKCLHEAVDHLASLDTKDGGYVTKDSGARAEFDSGMVRDTEEGKARFDLLVALGVPYAAQMLTRFADLMARGAEKYAQRNWEQADGQAELDRYKSSGFRHLVQWLCDEEDEDHAAAVLFNVLAYESTKHKMKEKK